MKVGLWDALVADCTVICGDDNGAECGMARCGSDSARAHALAAYPTIGMLLPFRLGAGNGVCPCCWKHRCMTYVPWGQEGPSVAGPS